MLSLLLSTHRRWYTPFVVAWALSGDSGRAVLADDIWTDLEPTEVLTPTVDRSDEDRDEVTAAAWLTRGRIHQLRDERAAALACYQRSYFWDPLASSILPQIVLLAAEEQQAALALRYALLGEKSAKNMDRQLQRRVAEVLVSGGELTRGAALYRRSLGDLSAPLRQWDDYLARFEAARLAYVNQRPGEAAELIEPVWKFLLSDAGSDAKPELGQLRRALLTESDQPLNLLLDVYLESHQPEQAQAVWKILQKYHADPATLAYRQAQIELLAQHPELALAELTAYHRTGATSAGTAAYDLLAQLIDGPREGHTAPSHELLEVLEKWRLERPENLILALYVADAWGKAGEREKSIARYRQILAQQGVQEAYVGLLEQLIATNASPDLLELLVEYMTLTGGLDQLGAPWAQLIAQPPLLREILGHARRRVTTRGDTEVVSWVSLILAGKLLDRAEYEHWLQLVGASPGTLAGQWLLEVAVDLILADEFELASRTLDVGLRRAEAEDRAQYYYYQCEALVQQDRLTEAVDRIREAAAAAPPTLLPTMQARYGWILYRSGQTDQACEMLRQLTNPGAQDSAELQDPDTVRQARMVLSGIYAGTGRAEEAEQELIQVLMDEPEHIGALNDLAYLWVDRGLRLDRSLSMLQHVVAAEPDNAAYRDSLGWAYFKLGRFDEAAQELRQASAGPEPDGVVLDHLGDALDKLGDVDAAVAAWERAVLSLTDAEQAPIREAVQQKIAGIRSQAE